MSGPNERLKMAMAKAGYTAERLATETGYHSKQVGRWINEGVIPRRPTTRAHVAELLGVQQSAIWPRTTWASAELVTVWTHRADVPRELWQQLLTGATRQLDVLVYAALFLPEQNPALSQQLRRLAEAGVKIRLLVGDPAGEQVRRRSVEEGIGEEAIGAKIRNVLTFYQPLAEAGAVEIRLHDTTLYASVYRSDDDLLVNPHLHGLPAAHAPAMHLRRLDDSGLYGLYAQTFEQVWSAAHPPTSSGQPPMLTGRA